MHVRIFSGECTRCPGIKRSGYAFVFLASQGGVEGKKSGKRIEMRGISDCTRFVYEDWVQFAGRLNASAGSTLYWALSAKWFCPRWNVSEIPLIIHSKCHRYQLRSFLPVYFYCRAVSDVSDLYFYILQFWGRYACTPNHLLTQANLSLRQLLISDFETISFVCFHWRRYQSKSLRWLFFSEIVKRYVITVSIYYWNGVCPWARVVLKTEFLWKLTRRKDNNRVGKCKLCKNLRSSRHILHIASLLFLRIKYTATKRLRLTVRQESQWQLLCSNEIKHRRDSNFISIAVDWTNWSENDSFQRRPAWNAKPRQLLLSLFISLAALLPDILIISRKLSNLNVKEVIRKYRSPFFDVAFLQNAWTCEICDSVWTN